MRDSSIDVSMQLQHSAKVKVYYMQGMLSLSTVSKWEICNNSNQ